MPTEKVSEVVSDEIDDFGDPTDSAESSELGSDDPEIPEIVDDGQAAPDEVSEESTEVESAGEPEPAEGTSPDPEAPETDEITFDPSLLDAAGITADQATTQFKTPEALENAVRLLDARFVQAGQQQLGQPPATQPAAQPQPQSLYPTTQPTTNQPAAEEISGLPAFQMPKPSEQDDWDDDTKALVKSLDDHYQRVIKETFSKQESQLQEQREALVAVLQERQHLAQQQYVREFDTFVDSLGEEYSPYLGKGAGYDLPQNSIQLNNRHHLDTIANYLQAGRQSQNQPELPRNELLKRALPIAFPEIQKQAIKREVTEKLSKDKK